MDAEEKFNLIARNAQEIVEPSELKELLKKKKNPIAYLGYAPTGQLHVGHFIPVLKMLDFVNAGFKFKFLIADLHAHLDDLKSPWELLDARSKYYEAGIKAMFKSVGGNPKDLEFVRGSSFEFDKKYVEDVLRMEAMVTLYRVKRAAAEVVRFGDQPKLGGFVYPLMQNEDVVALKADVAFSGVDQRGVYMLGREILPKLGHQKPVCVFTPLLPGLTGGKMSASVQSSKISITDSEKDVSKKVAGAYCPAGKVEENGVMEYCKHLIFPHLQNHGKKFVIERPEKFGGNLEFEDYQKLENEFVTGRLHPADLKTAVAKEFNKLLDPVRKAVKSDLIKKAYS